MNNQYTKSIHAGTVNHTKTTTVSLHTNNLSSAGLVVSTSTRGSGLSQSGERQRKKGRSEHNHCVDESDIESGLD